LKIGRRLRVQVAERANFRCEYCLIHEDDAAFSHEVDHVIGRQHCMVCNRFKGANITSTDSSAVIVRLFNPRSQKWADHFRLAGAVIEPLTETGEATSRLLRLNQAERVIERTLLQQLRRYPRESA